MKKQEQEFGSFPTLICSPNVKIGKETLTYKSFCQLPLFNIYDVMQTEKKIKKQKKTLLLLKALFMPMVLRRAELQFTSCVCCLFPPPSLFSSSAALLFFLCSTTLRGKWYTPSNKNTERTVKWILTWSDPSGNYIITRQQLL